MAFNCLQHDLFEIFCFCFVFSLKWLGGGGTSDMMSNWPEVWPNVNVTHYLFQAFPDKNTHKKQISILGEI